MDLERRNNFTIPLISRLDHLDFIMKRLESKHVSTRWASRSSEIMPLDLDAGEAAYLKGSLINRVASLEYRILQLLLEMDSSSSSRTSTLTPSQHTSSSRESKRELSSSSHTFSFSNLQAKQEPQAIPPNNKPEMQARSTSQRAEQKTKKSAANPLKVQTRKDSDVGEANTPCKSLSKKQQKPRTTLYIRLMGC